MTAELNRKGQMGGSHAIQAKKPWRATHSAGWLARSYADRGGTGHCSVCKDRRRAPEGDFVAREFGDNDAAGTPFRKHGKSKQGERRHSLPAETVGRGWMRLRDL